MPFLNTMQRSPSTGSLHKAPEGIILSNIAIIFIFIGSINRIYPLQTTPTSQLKSQLFLKLTTWMTNLYLYEANDLHKYQ